MKFQRSIPMKNDLILSGSILILTVIIGLTFSVTAFGLMGLIEGRFYPPTIISLILAGSYSLLDVVLLLGKTTIKRLLYTGFMLTLGINAWIVFQAVPWWSVTNQLNQFLPQINWQFLITALFVAAKIWMHWELTPIFAATNDIHR
jgi:hypothetical protein